MLISRKVLYIHYLEILVIWQLSFRRKSG